MRYIHRLAIAFVVVLLVSGCRPAENGADAAESTSVTEVDETPVVVLETSMGRVVIELDHEKAPETVTNFLKHVNAGFYNGLIFHRIEKQLGVIQAGRLTATRAERQSQVFPIANEADNGLSNVRGSVAMARTAEPHSAKSEFFINVSDNQKFDHTAKTAQGWGYAVFGKVLEGMNVVDAIVAVPTERRGRFMSLPLEPIVITRAYVEEEEAAEGS